MEPRWQDGRRLDDNHPGGEEERRRAGITLCRMSSSIALTPVCVCHCSEQAQEGDEAAALLAIDSPVLFSQGLSRALLLADIGG